MSLPREKLEQAFAVGVAAADPAKALIHAIERHPLLDTPKRIHVFAVGKAAVAMAEAAKTVVAADRLASLLVVTNPENARDMVNADVFAASHPVPDETGLAAGQEVIKRLSLLGPDDQVLALVSGGASALLPAPLPGVSLAEKAAVNDLLLMGGLDITAMNLVRQNLSQLKGGGLLRLAAPARVSSYILSDVLGDDLRVVGSGPTVGPIGIATEAIQVLESAGLWDQVPSAARQALLGQSVQDPLPETNLHLIGSNKQSAAAMAKAMGAQLSKGDLVGDVQVAAERVVAEAATLAPGSALAFGGETTVKLTGSGRGGRNQELALRVAVVAKAQGLSGEWCFLSGGTDGRDGPTDAAGGVVDHSSLERLGAQGISIDAVLADNASYNALAAIDGLLMTGATGTNVADLQIFCRGAKV